MVPPGYVLSVVVGLVFLGIGVHSWRNPTVTNFPGASATDGEGPSPSERVVGKIFALLLILLAIAWLLVLALPYWLF